MCVCVGGGVGGEGGTQSQSILTTRKCWLGVGGDWVFQKKPVGDIYVKFTIVINFVWVDKTHKG